jgi:cytochrome c oxidase subunit 1
MGAFYYWWPKAFGYRLDEGLGKWNFWLTFIGFNMTFGPMHILGLQGMPRRTYTYKAGYFGEWHFLGIYWSWNLVATIGGFVIALAVAIFLVNIGISHYRAHRLQQWAGVDPWDARSLEWMCLNPPPEHNFDEIPVVSRLDDFWYRKYREDASGRLVKVADAEDIVDPGLADDVHMPSPSYWPIVAAFGLVMVGYGMIFQLGLAALGGVILAIGVYGWALEPADDEDAPHVHHEPPAPAPLDTGAEAKPEEAALVD